MGSLTRADIVRYGLLKAGNTSLTAIANIDLNAWLKSQYAGWAWPFMLRSNNSVLVAAGDGNIGTADMPAGNIQSIRSPLFIGNSDGSNSRRLPVNQVLNRTPLQQNGLAGTVTGDPTCAFVAQSGGTSTQNAAGRWVIAFDALLNRPQLVTFDLYLIPDDLDISSAGDSLYPLYPNDRTMMFAVEAEALRYMKRWDEYGALAPLVASMVADDRMKFGSVPGQNDELTLDSSVYG